MSETPINLNAPKGVIRISISVMMPRPDRPEMCDSVDCEPLFFNVLRHKDKKYMPVELMPKLRSILTQMVELARTHVHAPLTPEQMIEKVEKPTGTPQIELYKQNTLTGEMVQVGQPIKLDANMNPIEPLIGSTRE